MFVVSNDTCPNQARMVLMSTPALSRCTAVVWRIVWGLTRLPINDGDDLVASFAQWVTRRWTPNRVIGWLVRPRKTGSFRPRPLIMADSNDDVRGQSGHIRSLLPLPRMRTDGDVPS